MFGCHSLLGFVPDAVFVFSTPGSAWDCSKAGSASKELAAMEAEPPSGFQGRAWEPGFNVVLSMSQLSATAPSC